jgi:drug/metabolite transporter (DMT)-like permease
LSILTTLGARIGVGLLPLMAWRYALATPVLAAIAGPRALAAVPWRRALALFVIGGGGQSLVTHFSLSALAWMPAASLGFLFYTYPAWVAIFAALSGTERLTPTRLAALALALLGITMMVGSPWNLALPWPGVWRALLSAVIYAAYIPVLHRLRGPLTPAAASAYLIAGAATLFLIAAGRNGGALAPMLAATVMPLAWTYAAMLALYCTVVSFLTFLRGLEVLGAVRAAILSTTEPLFTAVLALLVLRQPLGVPTLLGGACIVAAILVLERATPPTDALPHAA